MKGRKIAPHKGGRTARISIRATPQVKQALEQLAERSGKSTADLLEEWIKEKDKSPE